MNRALRTLLVSAAVLLSGTVAFAVAAAIAPPGVDGVGVVVTDRPVLTVSAASAQLPAAALPASSTPTVRADKPASTGAANTSIKTVVTGVVSSGAPKRIVVPAIKPKPSTVNTDTETDHEVVTPPVRDEDDDEHDSDDEHNSDSSSPSSDFESQRSRDTTRMSDHKGD